MSDYRRVYISSDSSASADASDSESDDNFWNESVKIPNKNLVKDYLSESAEDGEASDRDEDYSGDIIDNTLEQDYDQALDIGSGDAKKSSPSSVDSKEKESFLESSGASSATDNSANSSGSILKGKFN